MPQAGDGGRKAELKPIRRFLIFGRISGEIGIARSLTANEGGANPLSAVLHFVRKTAGVTFAATALAESQAWRRGHRMTVACPSAVSHEPKKGFGRRGEVGSGQGRVKRSRSRGNHATYPGISEAKWPIGR